MKTREMTNKPGEMTDKLRDWQKQATEKVRNVGEVTDRYVHENTWQSIAFAALFGCVIGYLLANRRD
jgi:ElaB/YqjD/DUF883 family membrane-anchored ribosome-binding protein